MVPVRHDLHALELRRVHRLPPLHDPRGRADVAEDLGGRRVDVALGLERDVGIDEVPGEVERDGREHERGEQREAASLSSIAHTARRTRRSQK